MILLLIYINWCMLTYKYTDFMYVLSYTGLLTSEYRCTGLLCIEVLYTGVTDIVVYVGVQMFVHTYVYTYVGNYC